jgi:hypothetical protein
MVFFTLDGRTEYWLYLLHGVDMSLEEEAHVPSHLHLQLAGARCNTSFALQWCRIMQTITVDISSPQFSPCSPSI